MIEQASIWAELLRLDHEILKGQTCRMHRYIYLHISVKPFERLPLSYKGNYLGEIYEVDHFSSSGMRPKASRAQVGMLFVIHLCTLVVVGAVLLL